jgi:hypothetical protein
LKLNRRLYYNSRKEKNAANWFIGAITDENNRVSSVPLSFLDKVLNILLLSMLMLQMQMESKSGSLQIEQFVVDSKTILNLKLANGGGAAVSVKPADAAQLKGIKKYK